MIDGADNSVNTMSNYEQTDIAHNAGEAVEFAFVKDCDDNAQSSGSFTRPTDFVC